MREWRRLGRMFDKTRGDYSTTLEGTAPTMVGRLVEVVGRRDWLGPKP